MRTHRQIIKDAGTAKTVSDRRGVSINTVRSWSLRDSIPSEHWVGFVGDGWASFDELGQYEVLAAARRRAERQAA